MTVTPIRALPILLFALLALAAGASQRAASSTPTQDALPIEVYLPIIHRAPLGPPYDMAVFMIGDGRLYEVQHSGGSQARHQTQGEPSRFYHTKGNEISAEWEELWVDGPFIMRGTDTSPGSGMYYTLYGTQGRPGSAWSPRFWNVGDVFQRDPVVVFYHKSDCSEVVRGFQTSWLLFEAYYPQYTFQSGITLTNVVQLAWLLKPDSQPEERYFYAQGYGLVGWSSQTNGFSYISEIHQPGQRPDNNREVIGCLDPSAPLSRWRPNMPIGPLPPPYRAK